jgi:GNAT superfamily N-acetyltransferase
MIQLYPRLLAPSHARQDARGALPRTSTLSPCHATAEPARPVRIALSGGNQDEPHMQLVQSLIWCQAQFANHPGESAARIPVTHHMAAHFDGKRITAMAGYRPWNDYAGDPCVLTHPEFRRRGQATAVVSAVVAAALDEGKLLLYQTLEANRGAVQIALNLGFEQYARHVAVRLKRESPSNPPGR